LHKIKIGIVEYKFKGVPHKSGAPFFIYIGGRKMKSTTIPQVECIEGKTRQEAVMLFNKRMEQLVNVSPAWEREGDVFWITYNKLVEEPENIVEAHELNGEYRYCEDCPHCDRVLDIYGNKDTRVKWGKCMKYGMVSVNLNKKVCDAYWENEERR
jgi:hypothetical protein